MRDGVVTVKDFDEVLEFLSGRTTLALDTETTGLRMWHGDRLFSIVIAHSPTEALYFNFHVRPDILPEYVLTPYHIDRLNGSLFLNSKISWYMHNAKFDMGMLYQEKCEIAGPVHCTRALGRVVYNDHQEYNLAASLERIGLKKDDGVEKWIDENKAYEKVQIPGKKQKKTIKHFDVVPFDIIVPYALDDARGTFALGESQKLEVSKEIKGLKKSYYKQAVADNEIALTKTIFSMEKNGLLIDRDFCRKAIAHEEERLGSARKAYESITGETFLDSSKSFQKVFASDSSLWKLTEKGNPSFESDVLTTFKNPAAKLVLDLRDAKSRSDFYYGFVYHADSSGYVHPSFNPDGTRHGRQSSSDPNFQNLTSETVQICLSCKHEHEEILSACEKCGSKELEKKVWIVRKAIIAPPGYKILDIDYAAMEYRLMLEHACLEIKCLSPLAEAVLNGVDVHQACADLATEKTGLKVTRRQAKTSNFLMLYGGGNQKLADQLGIPIDQASTIRHAILSSIPEVQLLIKAMEGVTKKRTWIANWFGRISHIPYHLAYKSPNYVISGGCADIVKLAMNDIHYNILPGHRTKMVLTVHDELAFYLADGEDHLIPRIKASMEGAFKYKYMPLVCSVYTSDTNLADLKEWTC